MSQTLAEGAGSVASVFAALGDRTRLSLLARLSGAGSLSITELAQDTSVTRQGITKHLKVLEDSGIVSSARVGRESRYVLRADALAEARQYLDQASRQWDDAILRLQTLIKE